MNKEQIEQLTNELSVIENYINLYVEDSLEKNNILTKLAEAIFWISYLEEGGSNEWLRKTFI